MAKLIRFQGESIDPDSRSPLGLFQLAFRLHDEGALSESDRMELRAHLDWLCANLNAPRRLYRRTATAISWFKETSTEHIANARAVAAVLERNDVAIVQVCSDRPGYVTHEDEHQVVAVPFRK